MRSKSILILIAAWTLCFTAGAQKPVVKMGDSFYKQFDFKTALQYYSRAIKKDSSSAYVRQQIADSYRHLNDRTNAEP